MERRTIYYSGHVQGVGFRYTAVSVARRHRVTGYVKNLCDGRVVLVAEGESLDLDRFLADVRGAMRDHIDDTQLETAAASGEFRGFHMQY
jgi:acylphosphatase